ncbi:MAG: hypothetical protein HY744_32745, partial [Deltaproteobacteria bacterium]|nr:hypothetical protein [Deltaproteobacteria bacterium]
MRNRVFFPQGALDMLVDAERIELRGAELALRGTGRRYKIVEAVRILREVTDGQDPHGLCGMVKSRAYLSELGGELLGDSMIVGDKAYEIRMGFV